MKFSYFILPLLLMVLICPVYAWVEMATLTESGTSYAGSIDQYLRVANYTLGSYATRQYWTGNLYSTTTSGSYDGIICDQVYEYPACLSNGQIGTYSVSWTTNNVNNYSSPGTIDFLLNITNHAAHSNPVNLFLRGTTDKCYTGSPLDWRAGKYIKNNGDTNISSLSSNPQYQDWFTVGNGGFAIPTGTQITYSGGAVNAPVANFNVDKSWGYIGESVALTDISSGPPDSWFWEIKYPDGSRYNSTSQNLPAFNLTMAGAYDVNLKVTNGAGSDWENETAVFTGYSSLHLDLDVKDQANYYLENTSIGLYDPAHGVWQNKTCDWGACGFLNSGPANQYPLIIGNSYFLAASKPGYTSDSETVTLTYDHQLLTLQLWNLTGPTPTPTPTWPTPTPTVTVNPNQTTLDVDIKDDWTGYYIASSSYGLYDPVHGEWQNKTCDYGACGFLDSGSRHQYPLVPGQHYTLAASKYGYAPLSMPIIFEEHHLYTLRLTPILPGNELHLDVDVKDSAHNYLDVSTIGIYDVEHAVWRNGTCVFGACGFVDSGASHEYPIALHKSYILSAEATGYLPATQSVYMAYDHQLITFYLVNVTPEPPVLHFDLDIIDGSNHVYLENTTIGLYDPVHTDWQNKTCDWGACGFLNSGPYNQFPLVLGNTYKVAASKEGYFEANQTVVFNYDHQLTTLTLKPSAPGVGILHMAIDIRNSVNKSYVEGANLSIYDHQYGEWQSMICGYGACGFLNSGAAHQYPLDSYQSYTITASKAGYRSASQDVSIHEDNQLFTLYLMPEGMAFATTTITPPGGSGGSHDSQTAPATTNWIVMLPGISALLLLGTILWVIGGGK